MAEVATIGSVHSVNGLRDRVGEWFRDKTINKIAIMMLHAYIPSEYKIKAGTRTADKISKANKILNFIIKFSPFNEAGTRLFIQKAIEEKLNMPMADFWKKAYAEGRIGCVDGVTTIACVAGAITAIVGALIPLINALSGAKQKKEDRELNPSELNMDTDSYSLQSGGNTNTGGGRGGNNNNGSNGGNNTLLYVGLGIAALYIVTKK